MQGTPGSLWLLGNPQHTEGNTNIRQVIEQTKKNHDSCSHKDKTNTGTWPIDVRITSSYELLTSSDSSAQIAYWQSICLYVLLIDIYTDVKDSSNTGASAE